MVEIIQRTHARYSVISEETAKALSHVAEILDLSEGDFLERENHPIVSEFVVLEGVRAYLSDHSGEEITINFNTKGHAITPAILRGIHDRSVYNLQIISKTSRVLIYNNLRMENEMQNFKDLQQFGYQVIMQGAFLS